MRGPLPTFAVFVCLHRRKAGTGAVLSMRPIMTMTSDTCKSLKTKEPADGSKTYLLLSGKNVCLLEAMPAPPFLPYCLDVCPYFSRKWAMVMMPV